MGMGGSKWWGQGAMGVWSHRDVQHGDVGRGEVGFWGVW